MQPDTWPSSGPAQQPAQQRDKPVLLIVGAIFAGVGLILGTVCILIVALDNDFRSAAVQTQGTVIGYETRVSNHRDDDDGPSCRSVTYAPVVRFTTEDGRTIEFTSGVSRSSKPLNGSKVDVLYDPDNPQHAKVDDVTGRLLAPVITGGLGGLFLLIGLVVLALRFRARRRA